ncbi:hypothetical protein KR074_010697 [Drosophila pseudoananassae]|nr:hypothetical protein KR074_010697 [Drosophila pseudoananassae]
MALQLQIEKLKGLDNYKAWSMTVRAYLESEDLWSVVENGPENNEEVSVPWKIYTISPAKTSLQSLLKDKRAKFLILCLIETKLCQFMVSIRTARDLWNYLRTQHSLR